jgi:hypothetical protein
MPLPSGSSKVTNRPHGCSWIPPSMVTPPAVRAATSLARTLARLMPGEPETGGLLALMLLQGALSAGLTRPRWWS